MKIIALLFALTSSLAFAKEKDRSPANEAPASVKELAAKMKRETRTRISAYNVSEDEANGCSEAGTHYNIKLQVKKAIRAMDKNDHMVIKHTWETVREIDTDSNGTAMEICAE